MSKRKRDPKYPYTRREVATRTKTKADFVSRMRAFELVESQRRGEGPHYDYSKRSVRQIRVYDRLLGYRYVDKGSLFKLVGGENGVPLEVVEGFLENDPGPTDVESFFSGHGVKLTNSRPPSNDNETEEVGKE